MNLPQKEEVFRKQNGKVRTQESALPLAKSSINHRIYMTGEVWGDTGESFQELVVQLLRRRYGHDRFVEVPDGHNGDRGLEGFSRDGCAYQCYAADEPISIADLYVKQRDKITEDTKKFHVNRDFFEELFLPTIIHCWVLVVPRHDSAELIRHAATKATEIRAKNLPYVSSDFTINIVVLDYFSEQRQQLNGIISTISLGLSDISDNAVANWSQENDSLVEIVSGKLSRLGVPQSSLHLKTEQFLRAYMVGQNLLQKLRQNFPEAYQAVLGCKSGRERILQLEALTANSNRTHLNTQLNAYKSQLSTLMRPFASQEVDAIAWEAISDWLMRCPLDFEVPHGA